MTDDPIAQLLGMIPDDAPDARAPLAYPWPVDVGLGWHDVEMDVYLSWPIVSGSHVFCVSHHESRSMAYLRWALHATEEDEGSAAARLGTLAHTAILEPDRLETDYVVEPEPDPEVFTRADGTPANHPKNTSLWKDAIALLAASGKRVVSREDYAAAMEMRDRARADPTVRNLIAAPGPVEVSAVAADPETGLLLKCRPDKLVPAAGVHANLKSTRNASRDRFAADIYNMGYYVSCAFYELALTALGFDHRRAVLVAIETNGPKELAAWELDEGAMDAGRQVVRSALREIARCVERDEWPGLPAGDYISLPHWAWSRVDAALTGY